MNAIIATYKPPFMSSNAFLSKLKKHFNCQKAGFSGTLDPFAKGLLVVAFGGHTKILPFLDKAKKTYRATLWLGAKSKTLDIEGVSSVNIVPRFPISAIENLFSSLVGKISYTPPAFSAKKINGKRAYQLAREGKEVKLKKCVMDIFTLKLLHYTHPFLHFEVTLSGGGFVRSLGEIIANRLGVDACLSSLERIAECGISLAYMQSVGKDSIDLGVKYPLYHLDSVQILPFETLEVQSEEFEDAVFNGRKVMLFTQKCGVYKWCFERFFSLIEVLPNKEVKYLCNRIEYANTIEKTR